MPGAVLDPFLALMYFILVAHNKMGKLSQLQMRNLRHRLNDSPKLGSSPEVVAEAVIETSCNTAFRLLSQPQLWACGLIFDLVPKSQCSNVGCNLGLKWLPLWKGAENAGRLQVPASDMCNTALVFSLFSLILYPGHLFKSVGEEGALLLQDHKVQLLITERLLPRVWWHPEWHSGGSPYYEPGPHYRSWLRGWGLLSCHWRGEWIVNPICSVSGILDLMVTCIGHPRGSLGF